MDIQKRIGYSSKRATACQLLELDLPIDVLALIWHKAQWHCGPTIADCWNELKFWDKYTGCNLDPEWSHDTDDSDLDDFIYE
jgi:hypothetical protein